ncbi:Glutathione S-transferase lancl1 [Allomyces javanicus]|nr:Glutathione S-transferase lancl1 [Allomyces javanicus]
MANHLDDPTANAACDTSAGHADEKLGAAQLARLACEYARSHGPEAADALSLSWILTDSYPEHDASLLHALVTRVVGGDADDDAPVYMGHAGAAWLLFKIHRVDPGFSLGSRSALAIAHAFAERALAAALATIERSRDDDYVSSSPFPSGVGFLCTPVGALAVTAAVRHHYQLSVNLGGEDAPDDGNVPCSAVIDTLAELNAFVQRHAFSQNCPSEVLFGRAGLVAALQFVARYIPETRNADHAYGQALPVADLQLDLVEAIIKDGRNGAAMLAQTHPDAPRLTLAWTTLGKWYLGAAHGAAGILTVLLALPDDLIAPYLDEIRQTVRDLPRLGEYPTTIDKVCVPDTQATDPANTIVQWCHGAVGLGLLFVRAYAKFGDLEFLVRATACGELAWEQGVVDKHVGLCHGVAGNEY